MEIVMPQEEKVAMVASLVENDDIRKLFARIEDAEASYEEDKINILKLVENEIGFSQWNNKVNVLVWEWIMKPLLSVVVHCPMQINYILLHWH